jgi:TP901 family phage tail tape measure protein
MAEGKGVRAWFRLVFDRTAADKVKSETQRALKGATDPKATEANVGRVRKSLGGLETAARRLTGVFLGVFSAAVIYRGAKRYDQAMSDLRRSTGDTGAALRQLEEDVARVMRSGPEGVADVTEAIGTLRTLTGLIGPPLQEATRLSLNFARVNKEQVGPTVDNLGRLFNALEVNASEIPHLLDMLTRASQESGLGVNELVTQLIDTGPVMDNLGFDLTRSIALFAQFNKAGVNSREITGSLSIAMTKMAQEGVTDSQKGFTDLLESIRDAPDVMEGTRIAAEYFGTRVGTKVADHIQKGRFEIEEFAQALSEANGTLADTARDSRTFTEAIDHVVNAITGRLLPASREGANWISAMGDGILWFIEQVEVLGAVVPLRIAQVSLAFQRGQRGIMALLRRDTSEIDQAIQAQEREVANLRHAFGLVKYEIQTGFAGALGDARIEMEGIAGTLGDLLEETAGGAEAVADALDKEVSALVRGHELRHLTGREMMMALTLEREITAQIRDGNLALEERNRLATHLQSIRGVTGGALTPDRPGLFGDLQTMDPKRVQRPGESFELQHKFVDEFAENWMMQHDVMIRASQAAAHGIASAWEDAFSAMRKEGAGVATFFGTLFEGVAAAGLGALSQYASDKVAVNLAEATEQFARAVGWSFLNPGQAAASTASAKQHLVAAAAWGAIGGAAGAGQSAVGGGGRAGMAGGLNRGSNDPFSRGEMAPEIHIYVDPLDPSDTRFQRVVHGAGEMAQQRYGKNAKITYHSGKPQ